MKACERPARHGPNKGKVRTGTRAGYQAHRHAGEAACEACAAAQSDYCRQWYEQNRESELEQRRQRYEQNRESELEQRRQRYEQNRESEREYKRRWYEQNRESVLERVRRWYEENAHIIRERYWANRTPSPDEDEPRWTVYRALYLSPDFDNDPWHGAVYYVGQTCRDPEQRWTEHVQSKRWLDNTLWQVVEAGLTRRQAFDLENDLVDTHYSTLSNEAAAQRREAEDIPHPPYRAFPATAFTNS